MSFTLKNRYRVFVKRVDQSVFLSNTTAPKTRQVLFKRLRFAQTFCRVSEGIFND